MTELTGRFTSPEVNVALLLCDRHPADRVAFTVVDAAGGRSVLTFGQLAANSHRYARALQELGVGPGDRVATLMGKSTELVTVILALWRLGAVYVPLFTAFAPQAIAMRLEGSGARVVIVDPDQRYKLDPGPDMPDDPQRRILVAGTARFGDDVMLSDLIAAASPEPGPAVAVGGEGPLVHMFTSGTTGKPKGVIHPVSYLAGWQVYLEYAQAVPQDGSYWCAADPGWAYGLYAAIIAPMVVGIPSLLLAGGFSVEKTWRTLVDHAVTDFAAAPTVYRQLRTSSVPVPRGLCLERASSAGEPLTPEINEWTRRALGLEVHDHFGQTEIGMTLANHHHAELARPIKTGSMGRPLPGWSLTVLAEERDEPAGTGVLGRIAIDVASPLMTFRNYQTPGQSASKFTADGRWYLTGDTGSVDADGDFFFTSRDDDVIIMAGYRIGPFEIESVLAQHPDVAECSVIAAPDEARGEVIEAYVVVRKGSAASPELAAELQEWVKTRYAAHAYPRAIHFIEGLPKTPSGKTQRYLLRSRDEPNSPTEMDSDRHGPRPH
ncbi:AMP-binding protein [Actinomadura madurae]|uniref:AMP-binding protein n=1 Tax=Actinomadura madurae TaxID=1993 RepID=UPI003999A754